MDLESLHWFLSKLREYINKPQTCSKFNRFRGKEAVISMQKIFNGRGSYLEVSKFVWRGKRQRIIIPSGRFEWGWKCVAQNLSKFFLQKRDNGRHFKEDRKPLEQSHKLGNLCPNFTKSGNIDAYENIPPCTVKNWSKALIITRECVNTSWELVRQTLGKAVQRHIEIFPFQANKAIWWPNNEEDASFYLRLKKCFLEKKVTLSFERWRQQINIEQEMFECCNSWVRLLRIPWDLWYTDLFKNIGEQCGGLLNISEDTTLLKDLSAAKIKVVGLQSGFINSTMKISTRRGPMVIRIVVDSVNIAAYDIYEKRSYAQVVVNGEKVLAGWGRAKCVNEGVSNLVPTSDTRRTDTDETKIQQLRDEEGSCGHTQKEHNLSLEIKSQSKAQEKESMQQNSGGRKCHSEPSFRGRQIKILQKLRPKVEADFQKMEINSVNNIPTTVINQAEKEEESSRRERKFDIVYRRKQSKEQRETLSSTEGEDPKISFSKEDIEMLDGDDGIWEDQLTKGAMDNVSDEGCESSELESHISATSEESTPHSLEFQDLGDFFELSPSKVCIIPNPS